MTSYEKVMRICELLSEKKAHDIVYIDVAKDTTVCEYFVVAGGRSSTQVRTLAEHLDEKMEEDDEAARRKEGMQDGRWAVLDFADVIVHIFNDEERDFYNLERLWEKGSNLKKYDENAKE